MNRRQAFLATVNHQEPERVLVDYGKHIGSFHTGAYDQVKAHFGLTAGTRILDRMAQNVVLDETVCQQLGIDFRWLVPRWAGVRDVEIQGQPGYVDMWHTPHKWTDVGRYYAIHAQPLGHDGLTRDEIESFDWPDPGNPAIFEGLRGEAKKWFEEASDIYLKKIKIQPYQWRHYYDYASCSLELDDLETAREYLIKALEYHGDFSVIIAEKLSRTLYELGRYDDAKLLLEALVVYNPQDYEYLGKMGMCFLAIGDHEKAFEAFNRSILLYRYVPEYLYGAGLSAAYLDKTEDVINIIKDLLEMDDEFIEVIEEEPTFAEMAGRREFFQLVDVMREKRKKKSVKPVIGLKKIRIPGRDTHKEKS